ncbi:MAG: histidine kinase [Candidatus Muproteobacteria bacterium RBG_16_65_34]|uniref:Histidine kinase n=1 Tax=Candidatus Muproteobacteria bacterium RBG_16_65_34 TaxID=1817760 RepID=A0A1F6TS86_9PROT|nr:MAG: histidine kinase [Candidatus Muproteobacteria bacterium RBG_16_65_34]
MSIGEICNREVVFIRRDAGILEAAQLMRQYHVGDLVVVDAKQGGRRPVGIVTDRDLVIEVIAEGVDMSKVAVEDVMSFELVTAREEDDILDTMKRMRAKGVRRVPVVDGDGALVGILSVDDLLELLAEEITDLAKIITREQVREKEKRK